jgi:DNA-binding MarR family transcriptional regulator
MRLFEKLRALRTFEKQYLHFFSTAEDYHLIGEIGYHQVKGKPLTLKQLFLLDVSSIATVQRRLRRLKELGLVQHRRSTGDRRAVELRLSPKCDLVLTKYDALMSSKPTSRKNDEPRHECGLCDSDAGGRNLLVSYLAQGLKRGDKCVLVAPPERQKAILAELSHRQKAAEVAVVSAGHSSPDAQVAFLKGLAREATQGGKPVCLAADMSWTVSLGMPVDAMLDIERRGDAFMEKSDMTALCVYDTRHFSSADFLRAAKCHRDHARHPIVLG